MKRLSMLIVFGILLILPLSFAKPDLTISNVQVNKETTEQGLIWSLNVIITNNGDEPVLDNFAVRVTDDSMTDTKSKINNVGVVQIKGTPDAEWFLSQKFRIWACKIIRICPMRVGEEYVFPIKPNESRNYKTSVPFDSTTNKLIIVVDSDLPEEVLAGRPNIEGLERPNYNNVIDEVNEENNEFWYGINKK